VSAGETVYSARVAYPDYLQRGRAQVVSFPLYLNGELASPMSIPASTFRLYSPDGQLLVEGTVDVVDDVATYSLTAGDLPATLSLGQGYREEWAIVCADEVPRTFRRDAAVVRYAAYPVVTDADLLGVYSDLNRQLKAGTTTFQAYIDEAWKRILGRLVSQGVFPEKVVESWSLREVHMELTLHLVCLDCHRASGGRWIELASTHKKEFEMAWGRLTFKESDGDGNEGSATRYSVPRVTFSNASPRRTWGGFGGL